MVRRLGLMAATVLLLGGFALADDVAWKKIAEVQVGDGKTEVTVPSTDTATKFRQVKIKVQNADVKLEKVALKYADGSKGALNVPGKMKSGEETASLELKDGDKRNIMEVSVKGECQYVGETATLVVYGLMKDNQ